MKNLGYCILIVFSQIACTGSRQVGYNGSVVNTFKLQILHVKNENLYEACRSSFYGLHDCLTREITASREVLQLDVNVLEFDFNTLESLTMFSFQKAFLFYPMQYQGVIQIDSGYIFVPFGHNNFWFDSTNEYVTIELEEDYDENAGTDNDPGCAYIVEYGGELKCRLTCRCH